MVNEKQQPQQPQQPQPTQPAQAQMPWLNFICPILPAEREKKANGTLELSPTRCLGPACALYVPVVDGNGKFQDGQCAIKMLPIQIALFPASWIEVAQKINAPSGMNGPIIRRV